MYEKLKNIRRHYEELSQRLSQPETYENMETCTRLQKEQNQLQPLMETFDAYERCLQTMEEAKALLSDPEFRELAQGELDECKVQKPELEQRLKLLLLPKDPNDERNVILEIRAGVGGEESALFASNLYRM